MRYACKDNSKTNEILLLSFMRQIPGYSRYRATEDGAIFSLYRGVSLRAAPRKLKPFRNPLGYLQVNIRADADCAPVIAKPGRQGQLVHILVCLAFHGVRPSMMHEVDHINHVRDDNRAENLRWVTRKQNIQNSPNHHRYPNGEAHHNSKLTEACVRQMRARREAGETCKRIAGDYGVSLHAVWHATTGNAWRHVK